MIIIFLRILLFTLLHQHLFQKNYLDQEKNALTVDVM